MKNDRSYNFWIITLMAFALLCAFPMVSYSSSGKAKEEKAPKGEKDKKGEGEKDKGEEAEKEEAVDDKKAITGGRFEGDAIYVHIQPMILPVINENGAQQIITLIIDLQVNEIGTAREIQSRMPRVKDSLMQKLYGGFGDGSLLINNTVNIPKLKLSVIKAIEEVVGQGKINDALVQALGQRML